MSVLADTLIHKIVDITMNIQLSEAKVIMIPRRLAQNIC